MSTNPFPSKVQFASYLQYSPRGASRISRLAKDVTYAIKQDGYWSNVRIIPHAIERLAAYLSSDQTFPFLHDCFGSHVALVPMPSSSLRREGTLWVPQRICEACLTSGLCREVLPCLRRTEAIPKSAGSKSRPTPDDHYRSLTVDALNLLNRPEEITLVDDVVTRGSSFIGAVARLQQFFPEATIRCFALIRTRSHREVETIRNPVEGMITYVDGRLDREP